MSEQVRDLDLGTEVDLDGGPGIPTVRRYASELIGTFFLVFTVG